VISPAVEEKMKSVLAGSKSLDDSIAALHKWVSHDIRYVAIELGRGGYVPRSAETVVRTGFGDCKDKAMLFLAALKKIGVSGYPVLLNINGFAQKATPSLGQFNHMIAAVKRGNTYEFADLTAPTYPVGHLPRPEQGSLAVMVKEKGGEQITLPETPASETVDETRINGVLGEDGNFSGTIENWYTGDLDPALRALFQSPLDSTRGKFIGREIAGQYFERVETDSLIAFDGNDFRAQARIKMKVVKAKLVSRAGDISLLTNPVTPMDSWSPMADLIERQKDRKLPYETGQIIGPSTTHVDVRIRMPAGWKATLPADVKLNGPIGRFEVKYSQSGNELHIERTIAAISATLPASRQSEIVDWLRKAGSDDGKVIVLKAPPHSVASRE
jgi:hypothetical protein